MTKIFHPLLALIASATEGELAKYVQFLKEEEISPRPDRSSDSWNEFINQQKETYVLVWLCMSSCEVIVSSSTKPPNSAWVVNQTKQFLDQPSKREHPPDIVMYDKDTKFTKEFTAKLKSRGVRTNSRPKASPNLNDRCERFIDTIKVECLHKFIVFGKRHLDYLVSEFVDYYNHHRSHMERGHLPPVRDEPSEVENRSIDQVEVNSYIGGLVKAYERKAA